MTSPHQRKQSHQQHCFTQYFTAPLLQVKATFNYNLMIDFNLFLFQLLIIYCLVGQISFIIMTTQISPIYLFNYRDNRFFGKYFKRYSQQIYICSFNRICSFQVENYPMMMQRLSQRFLQFLLIAFFIITYMYIYINIYAYMYIHILVYQIHNFVKTCV